MALIETNKVCWSCKKAEMVNKKDKNNHPYLQCPKCGATDTDLKAIKKEKE